MSTQRVSSVRFKSGNNPEDLTNCPQGIDLSTFFHGLIPPEVRQCVPFYHAVSMDKLAPIIGIAMKYLLKNENKLQIDEALYSNGLTPEQNNALVTSFYLLFRTCFKFKCKLSILREDLKKMNIPNAVSDEICKLVSANRFPYENLSVRTNRVQFNKLERIRWRVDVIISSGSLTRVMRPNLILQLIMKDGSITTFEVSIEQFNQLRHNVAKILYEMQKLERHPIIRIVNEFRRREEEEYNN